MEVIDLSVLASELRFEEQFYPSFRKPLFDTTWMSPTILQIAIDVYDSRLIETQFQVVSNRISSQVLQTCFSNA